ncbi:MAG: MoaD family protein [Candidatus Hodarchaeota archaeon]
MANVILKLMTIISTDVGLTQINYSDVDTLGDVIDQFMSKYGKKLRKSFVDAQGNLESHIVILVNGRNYLFLEELNTKLKDGDQVVISPPLVGG